jgi:formylglycine-generating enzyme required for sulfatase activity
MTELYLQKTGLGTNGPTLDWPGLPLDVLMEPIEDWLPADLALQARTEEQRRELRLAQQRLAVFRRRYGAEGLALACHGAFPMALTAELVYVLRENFEDLRDEVPWFRGADLLLSGLCQPIGRDLYQMSGAVRMLLLGRLRLGFGEARVAELEGLMGAYIQSQLDGEAARAAAAGRAESLRAHWVNDRPHWTALCCLSPGLVRERIEAELRRVAQDGDATERQRLLWSAMVESYGAMLPGEPLLLTWADQVAEGEPLTGDWRAWAAERGIVLVPKVVQVARIRFGDEESRSEAGPEAELDPNLVRRFEFAVVRLDGRGKILSRVTESATYFVEPLGAGVPPLELVGIPGDSFLMGSPESEAERYEHEGPQRNVAVSPFFMGRYPVTQAQWRWVAAELPVVNQSIDVDPSHFKGPDRPVESVSWLDAQEFCGRLTRLTGRGCRLPTEAEWEYACRAGTQGPFHFGETISTEVANYDGSSVYGKGRKGIDRSETTPVGSFAVANQFGLSDMHGNVLEWCEDHFENSYEGAPADGSAWINPKAENNASRVLRGGSWISYPWGCRSAYRRRAPADYRDLNIGFRVVYSSASPSL